MSTVKLNPANHFLLQKHHLTENSQSDDVVKTIKDIFGLHATSAITPYLSLFSRMRDFTFEKLNNELSVKKTLAKIRCVRKTVYIIPKNMIPSVFSATRKMLELISERHCKYLGVSKKQYEELSKQIMEIIKGK